MTTKLESGEIIDLDKVSNKEVETLDLDWSPSGCGGCGGKARRWVVSGEFPEVRNDTDRSSRLVSGSSSLKRPAPNLSGSTVKSVETESRFGPDKILAWPSRDAAAVRPKNIVPAILGLARDVPEAYADLGCGRHELTNTERALILAGYEHAEFSFPAPPVTYSLDVVAAENFPGTEPEVVLGSLATRPAVWKRAFIEALMEAPAPERIAAIATLATALRPPTDPAGTELERDLAVISDWVFEEWLAELVVFEGYDDPGRGVVYDEAATIRRVGGWYRPSYARAMPTPCWRAGRPFPTVDELTLDQVRERGRAVLGALRDAAIRPDPTPPGGGFYYPWSSDDRQWPRDHLRPPPEYPSRLLEFDDSARLLFEWIEARVSATWPAPLHGMYDPRDRIPWKQKQIAARFRSWARLHGGTVDVERVWDGIRRDDADGTERFDGVRMLEAYLARRNSTVLPGWRAAVSAAVEEYASLGWAFAPAVQSATAVVQPEDPSVAAFYQRGFSFVRYVGQSLAGELNEAILGVEGWFLNPPGSWKICFSPSTGAACSEEEFCVSRGSCYVVWRPTAAVREAVSAAIRYANETSLRLNFTDPETGLFSYPEAAVHANWWDIYFREGIAIAFHEAGLPYPPEAELREIYAEETRGPVADPAGRLRYYRGARDPFADLAIDDAELTFSLCETCFGRLDRPLTPGTYHPWQDA